jgi:hypothetical protein
MSALVGKAELNFEPKMLVVMDAVANTLTPENMRPTLGYLSQLTFKPTEWRYLVRLSAAPSQGSLTIVLYAGGEIVRSETVALNGLTIISNRVGVSLANVSGETQLHVQANVTVAANSGITATVDSIVAVDQPLVLIGC